MPCEFWNNADELAYQVASTLSIKFLENNRNGWMPYNEHGITLLTKIDDLFVGEYDLLYYSELKGVDRRIIKSKLNIEKDGKVVLYNNIKTDTDSAEYVYHGVCNVAHSIIYIYLKNDFSEERATIYFTKPAGNANRLIGLFIALSSNMIPICIKVACFKEKLVKKGINEALLKEILTTGNIAWENSILIIEERQKHLFYSDEILLQ